MVATKDNDSWKKEPELIENTTRYCGVWYAHIDRSKQKVPKGMYLFSYRYLAETEAGRHEGEREVVCHNALDFLKLLVVWNGSNPTQYKYFPTGIDLAVK